MSTSLESLFTRPTIPSIQAQLGVAPDRQKRLNCKLHAHAIGFMHALIKLIRLEEAGLTQSHVNKRKKPPDK